MADTTIHYLTYDAEAMWLAMMQAYVDVGGDVLYPGDEKEMLLRGVQEILARAYAAFDNAARMRTLRYAALDYLILGFGEPRGIEYADAIPARGKVELTFAARQEAVTIEAGELMTQDGVMYYRFVEAVNVPPSDQVSVVSADIECTEAGVVGNGLAVGTQLDTVRAQAKLLSVIVASETSGGVDAEDVEAYRERVRTGYAQNLTTGTREAYRSRAMAVTQNVVDAYADVPEAGRVDVAILPADDLSASERAALVADVLEALSPSDARPVTDQVAVYEAAQLPYNLIVRYKAPELGAEDIQADMAEQVEAYQAWQEHTLGRAFDPFNLVARMYSAGAQRVMIDTESTANGGAAEYTEIAMTEHWAGEVVLEEMTT